MLAAASRQGLAAAYLGPHGTGRFGDQVRADLAAEGVAVTRAASPEGDSGFCIGLVDDAAERTYATRFGVEGRLTAAHLADLGLGPDDAVYLSGYDLAYAHGPVVGPWFAGLGAGHLTFFDPGPGRGRPRRPPCCARSSAARTGSRSTRARPAPSPAAPTRPGPRARGRRRCRSPARGSSSATAPTAAGCSTPPGPTTSSTSGCRCRRSPRPTPAAPGTATSAPSPPGSPAATTPAAAARWANAAAALCVQRLGPATGPTYAEVAVALAAAG